MQIEFISVCPILTNTPRQDNKARSFTENIGGGICICYGGSSILVAAFVFRYWHIVLDGDR